MWDDESPGTGVADGYETLPHGCWEEQPVLSTAELSLLSPISFLSSQTTENKIGSERYNLQDFVAIFLSCN